MGKRPVKNSFAVDANGEEEEEPGQHFNSTAGIILSCMGCVVGTGNIWRFPRIVANNSDEKGGLVFLIVWLFFLLLWSIPMLLIEYATGRYTKKSVISSFRALIGDNHIWCGAWVSLVTFCISSFYAVVLGWCLYYFVYYIGHELPENETDSRETFRDYAEDSYWPVLTHSIAILFAGLSVAKGVKTIEKVNSVLVPLLLSILLFTFIWSLTREYTDHGIRFLFSPSWASFGEPRLWVDAVSQNAFDTGAGMGIFIPYASYMKRRNGIVRYGSLIPAANNLISLICGITIFGTVFATLTASRPGISQTDIVDILKDSGPASTGLTFIWIPVLFSTIGTLGRVLAVLFFLSLSCAGVTSLMSNFELVTHTFQDFGLSRKFGMPLTVLMTFGVGLMSALNINILTNQDFVWGFALVVNGMMLLYMVLRFGVEKFRQEVINNHGIRDWHLPKAWSWIIRIVAPLEALTLIIWWAVDLITADAGDGEEWYTYGRETLVMTLTQWIGAMLILIAVNILWQYIRNRKHVYNLKDEISPLLIAGNQQYSAKDGNSRDLYDSVKEIKL